MKRLIESELFSYLMAEQEVMQPLEVQKSIESFAELMYEMCDNSESSQAFRVLNFTRVHLQTLRGKYLNLPIKEKKKCNREISYC